MKSLGRSALYQRAHSNQPERGGGTLMPLGALSGGIMSQNYNNAGLLPNSPDRLKKTPLRTPIVVTPVQLMQQSQQQEHYSSVSGSGRGIFAAANLQPEAVPSLMRLTGTHSQAQNGTLAVEASASAQEHQSNWQESAEIVAARLMSSPRLIDNDERSVRQELGNGEKFELPQRAPEAEGEESISLEEGIEEKSGNGVLENFAIVSANSAVEVSPLPNSGETAQLKYAKYYQKFNSINESAGAARMHTNNTIRNAEEKTELPGLYDTSRGSGAANTLSLAQVAIPQQSAFMAASNVSSSTKPPSTGNAPQSIDEKALSNSTFMESINGSSPLKGPQRKHFVQKEQQNLLVGFGTRKPPDLEELEQENLERARKKLLHSHSNEQSRPKSGQRQQDSSFAGGTKREQENKRDKAKRMTECLSEQQQAQIIQNTDESLHHNNGDDADEQEFDEEEGGRQEEPEEESLKPDDGVASNQVYLLQSVFEGRPPTIFFQYPKVADKTRDMKRAVRISDREAAVYNLKYNPSSETRPYKCVVNAFEAAGFRNVAGSTQRDWNGFWGIDRSIEIQKMCKHQKLNHFPGCWNLGRKDLMYIRIQKVRRRFPQDFDFVPRTFLLSTEYERVEQLVEESANASTLWIMKPVDQCCGVGVKVISKKLNLKPEKRKNYLVEEYIAHPHLINGLKYDLRVYILVSCYNPLRIYMHEEGLVRFATKKYDLKSGAKSRFMHLTNYSVNKKSEDYVKNRGQEDFAHSSKWSFAQLRQYFTSQGIDHNKLFARIQDVLVKVVVAGEGAMLTAYNMLPEHRNNCFEIYGFDILLDEALKVYCLECNVCPSLSTGSKLDRQIKNRLLSDTLNLVGFYPYDKKKYKYDAPRRSTLAANDPTDDALEGSPLTHHSKSVRDAENLTYDNCLEKLSPDDWEMLFECEEEMYRRGGFERIFPPRDLSQIDYYAQFFEFPRYNNEVLWSSLKSKRRFVERLAQEVHHENV